jgi:septal ring factor EnvC (AmiA/AmiB activator)
MIRSIFFAVFLILAQVCIAQSKSDLQKKRDDLNRRLELTKKLIAENQNSKASVNQQMLILRQQISYREQLLSNMQREVKNIDEEITQREGEIELLEDRIAAMKREYALMIQQAYKNQKSHDALMYIFSADDFNQAYKRFKIIQNYSEVRKEQAEEIEATQVELRETISALENDKLEKTSLAEEQAKEREKLAKDKESQQKSLSQLQQQEGELKSQQEQQERERQRLNKKIEEMIAAELADEKNANNGTYALSPEGVIVSQNFEKNKGQLPWPVERGVITRRFGKQPHPTLGGITIDSKGVDFATEANANVMAIFGGTVTSVFNIPGAGQNVIITHGAYKTVYTGLKNVSLSKGDTVNARQTIGKVLSDNGKSLAHLEIWKISSTGGTPQNPLSWIVK